MGGGSGGGGEGAGMISSWHSGPPPSKSRFMPVIRLTVSRKFDVAKSCCTCAHGPCCSIAKVEPLSVTLSAPEMPIADEARAICCCRWC